jgi:hypothetical protein
MWHCKVTNIHRKQTNQREHQRLQRRSSSELRWSKNLKIYTLFIEFGRDLVDISDIGHDGITVKLGPLASKPFSHR